MHRLLVVALAVAAVVLPGSAAADNPKLFGSVGPGFTISLKDASGNLVEHVDAGTYDVVVQDLATEHDFHLFGPGVDKSTDVEFTGTVTWTVTLADGVYHFQCDPHASVMHGAFSVGSVTGTTTTTTSPPPPRPKRLVATVGPGYTISLRNPAGRSGSPPAARSRPGVRARRSARRRRATRRRSSSARAAARCRSRAFRTFSSTGAGPTYRERRAPTALARRASRLPNPA